MVHNALLMMVGLLLMIEVVKPYHELSNYKYDYNEQQWLMMANITISDKPAKVVLTVAS